MCESEISVLGQGALGLRQGQNRLRTQQESEIGSSLFLKTFPNCCVALGPEKDWPEAATWNKIHGNCCYGMGAVGESQDKGMRDVSYSRYMALSLCS